jgi:glycosyltransferase involved in cell wall biosynthesis
MEPTADLSLDAAPIRSLVDVVVPVHNEAHVIEERITTLHAYLGDRFPFPWRITIADNGSTDDTAERAGRLALELPGVHAFHIDAAGRGRAVRAAWTSSPADVVVYMDVDLSTDLDALLPLVAPLLSGHSDLAIGSRLAPGAHVMRRPLREAISRAYNLLLRVVLNPRVRDAQCGFKAIRAEAAELILPEVQDDEWFFDTELLVRARRAGLQIIEIPVRWTDDLDSRVAIVPTAIDDLRGIWRLARARHR